MVSYKKYQSNQPYNFRPRKELTYRRSSKRASSPCWKSRRKTSMMTATLWPLPQPRESSTRMLLQGRFIFQNKLTPTPKILSWSFRKRKPTSKTSCQGHGSISLRRLEHLSVTQLKLTSRSPTCPLSGSCHDLSKTEIEISTWRFPERAPWSKETSMFHLWVWVSQLNLGSTIRYSHPKRRRAWPNKITSLLTSDSFNPEVFASSIHQTPTTNLKKTRLL